MLNKKLMILAIFFVSLLAISAVSAADNATNDVVSVEETNDDAISVDEADEVASVEDNQVILGNESDVGTFDELSSLIENTTEGNTLELDKNYKYVNGSTEGIQINKAITIDGKGYTLDGNHLSRIFNVYTNNVILKNISFINGFSDNDGGAVCWHSDNSILFDCIFVNCSSFSTRYGKTIRGGAIYFEWSICNSTLSRCSFVNCSSGAGGAIYSYGFNVALNNCSFLNCSTTSSKYDAVSHGGAVCFDGENHVLSGCSFVNCTSFDSIHDYSEGGAVYWWGNCGCVSGCSFVNCFSGTNGGAVYWTGAEGILDNCTFYNNFADTGNAVYWNGNGGIINNSYFSPNFDSIYSATSDLTIIKIYSSSLFCDNISFLYGDNVNLFAYLNTYGQVIFNIFNEVNHEIFIKDTTYEGFATLSDELNKLNIGQWNVTVIFEGNDNYAPCNATATITVLPPSTSLTIDDVNATVGHEVILSASVVSSNNLTINESTVSFFDGETLIGEANVNDSVATLTYAPSVAGEHTITAIFNSNNYLSSNSTARLLVDSATVEVLVNQGTVGFNSTFVAEVKGLYSIINEGNVKFYVDNRLIDTVAVVDGSASIDYVPLTAKTYSIKAVFGDSDKFLSDEDNVSYLVVAADSSIAIEDMNGTVGYDITIVVNITSSNNLTINEGYVVFFDGFSQIGESNVNNGVATFTYTPTTSGEHPITAMYYGSNYEDNINSALLNVSKAEISLSIDDISTVFFSNPSNFKVNVISNSKRVDEGLIKYYVNNQLIETLYVFSGISTYSYTANATGTFNLKVVYDETDNYFASNTSTTFHVNKMPTTLAGESVIFDQEESKTFTTELKNNNDEGVNGQTVKIEAIKYSGESRTFTGVSNADGITIYDVGSLAGGMWYVSGIYGGNENYIESRFLDKFIVIRMDTTTEIENISSPLVNHSYKLKANIHDENGKLVKEGIVQFYLDGVDIGSIDLSKNQGHQSALSNGLLGAVDSIFENELGAEEEISDLYIEYIPTKAGKHTLTAVYEGTTIYKSSNSTTTFTVSEEPQPIDEKDISIQPLSGATNGVAVVKLPSDARGTITLSIAGKEYKFDVVNGVANVKVPDLANGNYPYTITYSGDSNYSSFFRTGSFAVNNPVDNPTQPEDKTTLTLKTVKVKKSAKKLTLQATLKKGNAPIAGVKIIFKFNGKKYTAKTNAKGVAKAIIKSKVLKKLKVGKKVKYQASYGNIIVKKTVKVKK